MTLNLANQAHRTVFIVSDGTGITAETFAHSVLAQFDHIVLRQVRIPFVDSVEKAHNSVRMINETGQTDGFRPIVFSTLVEPTMNQIVRQANAMYLDLFQTFVEPLEQEFGVKSTHTIGRFHNVSGSEQYKQRIEAINFTLAHDDGQTDRGLEQAEIILVGVSRCGKTPTSLYLAMQFALKTANYPLIPDDFERERLPEVLYQHKPKIFGLSISAERLSEIRHERRAGSKYAALENCRYEVNAAEAMMRREGIRWLSSTTKSIEEIATTILQELKIERRL